MGCGLRGGRVCRGVYEYLCYWELINCVSCCCRIEN